MPERYITDTGDEFGNSLMQQDLDTLGKNVMEFLEYADTGDQDTLILDNISNIDVKHYIKDMVVEGRIPNLISYNCVNIDKPEERADLCNYLSVTLCDSYTNEDIQAYFLETGDFALAMYAIQTGSNGVTLRFEPLDDSPEFLIEKWRENI